MSNFFAAKRCVQACTTEASTSTMEAATSAPAVGYTVEQVRAQQNDRIFRRAVQNLHVQIIEVTGEHARTHARTGDEACEALEKLPAKGIDRAQSDCRMRIFVAAKALTSILTTRSMAALAPCELTQVPLGVAGWALALGCPYPARMRAACLQQAAGPVVSRSRLPTGAFAASNLNVLLGSTGTSNTIFFQLSWPEFRAWQRD